MPPLSRSRKLSSNSESALMAAIEIYNKPDFNYREETFAILALNAWELLIKAKILADWNNNPRSLYVYEPKRTKSGTWSKNLFLKRNRTGNPHTLNLNQAVGRLEPDPQTRLSNAAKMNLDALTEIRDNAIHYMNANAQLAKQILEIGTASLRNYMELARRWFGMDLSKYNLYLMPIGFISSPGAAVAINASPDEKNLIEFLRELIRQQQDMPDDDFHVALNVDIALTRNSTDPMTKFAQASPGDPDALQVAMSEEDIRKRYPWDYEELIKQCKRRYKNFKLNKYLGIVYLTR